MKLTRDNTYIILLGSITIITITAWMGSEIYRNLVTDRITPDVTAQIQELPLSLNTTVLNKLKIRTVPVDASVFIESTQPK